MPKEANLRFYNSNMGKVFILLAAVIALIYSNTLEVPFVLDDLLTMTKYNELIQIKNFSQINLSWLIALIKSIRPVVLFSFASNYFWGGLNVFGYHLVNLIIHILTSCTVFIFIRSTLNLAGYRRRHSGRIALATSLIFAVHPIQIQAVTYIVQRATSLATFFYLWTLLFYNQGRTTGRKRYFFFCFFFGLLAVGTKQNAVILPLTIFLYEFYFFQQRKKEWLKKKRVLIALIILVPILISTFQLGFNLISGIEKLYQTYSFPFSPFERVLTEQRVLLHYLSLIVFPLPSRFCADYTFPVSRGLSAATVIAIAFHAVALVMAARLAKSRPVLSFFILWFYINHVVESTFLGLDLVFEHRMYLPSIGLFCIAGLCYKDEKGRWEKAKMTATLVIFVLLGVFTYQRNQVWRTDVSFWEDVVKKSPNSTRALLNLGDAYLTHGKVDKAMRECKKAYQLDPNNLEVLNNLGVVFKQNQEWAKAEEYFRRALQLEPGNLVVTFNLAEMFTAGKRYEEAKKLFLYLISRDPGKHQYHWRLATVLMREANFYAASEEFFKVVLLKPDFKDGYFWLWKSLLALENPEKAMAFLEKAITAGKHPITRQELSNMLQVIKDKHGY